MNAHSAILRVATLGQADRLVTAVMRRWRRARDRGQSAPQRLHALLSPRNRDMLAPAFASLMALYEHALRRPIATGSGARLSRDERVLLGLLDGSLPRGAFVDCTPGLARVLDSALGSTRIMMTLMSSAPIGPEG